MISKFTFTVRPAPCTALTVYHSLNRSHTGTLLQAPDRSLAELKEFAGQLKGLPQLQRHINLTDAVNQQLAKPGTRTRVAIEHSLLEGHGLEAACESIEVRHTSFCPHCPYLRRCLC